MNLPNKLTILRIILVPVFVFVLLVKIPYGEYFAALIFIVAALTDSLDGYLARRWRQITKLGIILDPLADKLLITAALISLVELRQMPGWIAIVIIGREFAVSGLRAVKAEEGVIIPASIWGKLKTLTQVIAIILLLMQKLYLPLTGIKFGMWAMYIAVVITIISGVEYFLRFRIAE
ncbi:CDP-diacylglycerol--glycerol-3-phosphate 3-phosphatidyltransferase [Syntrophomonas palmitatica]|uniref:CDP-diacylglycerol--glycerol-3-phosphate 3-phosphatidyltransferase n=1 Tax=Syntrophomonas palmitatica TaxID=402877 RepID=UPI0006CF47C0|nr:CDP-diacylglycerol--glycerol-3-phosphate 3-phosphatidyltransferase [Syntrophomonas palmitatica]